MSKRLYCNIILNRKGEVNERSRYYHHIDIAYIYIKRIQKWIYKGISIIFRRTMCHHHIIPNKKSNYGIHVSAYSIFLIFGSSIGHIRTEHHNIRTCRILSRRLNFIGNISTSF